MIEDKGKYDSHCRILQYRVLLNYITLMIKYELVMYGTEQNRTEQNRTEQNRTEQNRTEHDQIFHLVDENSAIFGCILYCSFRRLGCIPPIIKTGIEKSRICVNQFVLVSLCSSKSE